ncbi:glycosyltransferase family 4 protein [Flavihumibacter sp. R14]|nr:glycosyltransferase family 4 protein [Flavihumibacter soli]
MKRLAIITTHPIQYYAPIFKLLHERKEVEIRVYYSWGHKGYKKHDPGFVKIVEWDLPLMEGYPFEWLRNTSRDPGSHRFSGIINLNLIDQIQSWKPDAVLVFGWAYNSHLKALRYFKGKLPVYFRGDSNLLDATASLKNVLKYCFLRWVYSHVDHAFYVGSANRKYFLKHGINESQLSFTPHAVDNVRFQEDRMEEASALRRSLGITKDKVFVLFAGKFEPKKDPLLLLNAFLNLKSKNAHLLFAGNGVLEDALKSRAVGLKSYNIHFMDFQNQTHMPVLYQACDLFCLPSRGPGESWGLAINEAMACGKAILTSDKVGAAYDLVKEGKNGYIFKSGNLPHLMEKLELLTANKSKLGDFGEYSKKIITEWELEAVAKKIEMVLNNDPV